MAIVWDKTADGAAGTVTTEKLVLQNPPDFDRKIEAVTLTTMLRVDDAAVDYATITLRKRPADGGDDSALAVGTAGRRRVAAPVAELSSRSQPWQQFSAVPFSFTGDRLLRAGEILTLDIAKAGAGVIVPASIVTIWLVDA